jgi:hypothetical protein
MKPFTHATNVMVFTAIILIIAGTVTACAPQTAASAVQHSTTTNSKPTPGTAVHDDSVHGSRLCGFLLDVTDSLDPTHRKTAFGQLDTNLIQLLADANCTDLAIGEFSDLGEWSAIEHFPLPETVGVDCTKAPVHVGGIGEILKHNAAFQKSFERKAQADCEIQKSGLMEQLRQAAEPARAHVRRVAEITKGTTGDTDIVGAISAVLRENSVVLAFTDGKQTTDRPLKINIPNDALLVMVIVPAKENEGGLQASREAAKEWQHEIDHLVVVPYTVVGDPAFPRNIMSRTQNRP